MVFTVTKKDDTEWYVRSYNIDSRVMIQSECFKGKYIKLKEIEQTEDGQFFAVAYIDNGAYKIRTFSDAKRSEAEINEEELNINEILEIDYST